MKEDEPKELTTQANSSTLNRGGNVFMSADEGNGGAHDEPRREDQGDPEETPEKKAETQRKMRIHKFASLGNYLREGMSLDDALDRYGLTTPNDKSLAAMLFCDFDGETILPADEREKMARAIVAVEDSQDLRIDTEKDSPSMIIGTVNAIRDKIESGQPLDLTPERRGELERMASGSHTPVELRGGIRELLDEQREEAREVAREPEVPVTFAEDPRYQRIYEGESLGYVREHASEAFEEHFGDFKVDEDNLLVDKKGGRWRPSEALTPTGQEEVRARARAIFAQENPEEARIYAEKEAMADQIDSAEDFFAAAEKLIRSADEKTAKEAIDANGESVVRVLTDGMGRKTEEHYLDELRSLRGLSAGEARERFVDIISRVKRDRQERGMQDPLTTEAAKHPVGLTESERQEVQRLQREGEERDALARVHRAASEARIEAATRRLEQVFDEAHGGSGRGDRGNRPTHEDSSVPPAPESRSVQQVEAERDQADYLYAATQVATLLSTPSEQISAEDKIRIIRQEGLDDDLRNAAAGVLRGRERDQAFAAINRMSAFGTSPEEAVALGKQVLVVINAAQQHRQAGSRGRGEDGEPWEVSMNSLEDVAKFIANKINSDLYGPEGLYPIVTVDAEGKEHFNKDNFLIFAREYTLSLHKSNSNDAISPLQQVALEARFRAVTLMMMVKTNRQQYFKDRETGRVLEKLADQTQTETWGFGIIRNTHLAYRTVMTSDEDLPKANRELHGRSDITRSDTLKRLMSAPDSFERGELEGAEKDTLVGDAFRFANDFYYNLSDREALIKILGPRQITKEDFLNALRIIQKKKEWEAPDSFPGYYDAQTGQFYYQAKEGTTPVPLFDKNGNIDMTAFVNNLNFYSENTAKETLITLVRELVRIKAAQRYSYREGNGWRRMGAGLAMDAAETADFRQRYESEMERLGKEEAERRYFARREGLRVNLEWGETLGYEIQRSIGAAARNDTNRRGFDAATKLFIRDYLIRQSGDKTAGPIGIPEEIPIIKTLGVDMWSGLRTESGISPLEIFGQLRRLENGEEVRDRDGKLVTKEDLLAKLRFRDRAESEFAGNQVGNGFDIFHSMSDSKHLDLNQIVTYSFLEGIKFNPQKFEEMVNDGFIKPMRYAFSSNAGLDFSSTVRWYDYSETLRVNAQRKAQGLDPVAPIYKDVTLAEYMFSDQVLTYEYKPGKNLLTGLKNGDADALKFVDSSEGRLRIVKNIARSRIAAQLHFHTKFGGTGEYWGYNRTETFIDALKTLRGLELDPKDPSKLVLSGKSFFDEEDIEWIRQQANVQVWRMLAKDTLREGGPALAGGLWDALKIFIKGLQAQSK